MAFDKPVRVARFGGTSSTEATNSTEPSSGKKDLGWELDEPPASSFFNWLHYRTYKWFRWFNERMFDGATSADFTVKAPAPAATSNDGGDLLLDGGDSGTDADKSGGDAIVSGGDATGSGSSKAVLMAATKGASGITARTPEIYLKSDGNDEFSTALKPLLVNADPASGALGAAIGAVTTGDGYAAVFTGDTTSPVNAAVRLTPQNADPSSPANGDLCVHSASDHLAHYNAAAAPARYQNLDPLIKTLLVDSDAVANTTTEKVFEESTVDIEASIPANTLRAGSVIVIRAFGSGDITGTPQIIMRARLNGISGPDLAYVARTVSASFDWVIDVEATVRSLGVSGAYSAGGYASIQVNPGDDIFWATYGTGARVKTIDTTGVNKIGISAKWDTADAANSVVMHRFTVRVL